jgi:uncharacterized damage-inducible protein DinB
MLSHHRRLLAFDHWANLETLNAATAVAERAPKPLRYMAHVAAAKRLWFARVARSAAPLPVWPTLTVDECRSQLIAAHDEWTTHLGPLAETELSQLIAYTNTRGEAFSTPLADILTHLPLHGHHHRGQAVAAIREAGGSPPVIDFTHASRRGLI